MSLKRKKAEPRFAPERTLVVLLHGGYWLLYLLLLAVIFAVAQTQLKKSAFAFGALLPLIVLCLVPNLISFYAFYGLLFPRFLVPRRFLALSVSGVFACLIAALAGSALSLVFFGFEQPIFADAREFAALVVSLSAIAGVHGGTALVIRGFVAWASEIKLKEELARKNYETELALVKSQINPHFLFNTLNNIDVLIAKNPELASRYLNQLSGILRYLVYETGSERIALRAELDYLEKYLALQKIRAVNPDFVGFEVAGDAGDRSIAPMIFLPFIENAFKHTADRKNLKTIRIKISIEKDKLVFECENSYRTRGAQKQDFGGLGNELVEKRLRLLYPETHVLEIDDREGIYRVRLTLVL